MAVIVLCIFLTVLLVRLQGIIAAFPGNPPFLGKPGHPSTGTINEPLCTHTGITFNTVIWLTVVQASLSYV